MFWKISEELIKQNQKKADSHSNHKKMQLWIKGHIVSSKYIAFCA